ncbi:serine/threonine protein phosphatase [Leptolyngbya sp. FACHB-36]|uniref:metallophosphoesterase family protein n=1 Tax=Leptolyngbya sp. FACHB-36 TaxID=2692808 RepID=UPI0016809423|nr:metallophosphoesterase family protein [Leptolyngbya sp. FACHB-36]MBD2021303.1 serine/threonine protein phosphatase [Leptolyngbya sp. FACHB-36]
MSEDSCRRIIIGDVHGHYAGLMTLLEAIAPGQDDQVYFLGDLIDRGPDSAKVVDFVQQNLYTCLLGNHEQLMLDAFPNGRIHAPALQAWLYSGGRATVASYGDAGILLEHLNWFKQLPMYLDLGDVWLVHAGVNPHLPLASQSAQEFCWIRDEFHSSATPYFSDKLIITGHTITFTLPKVAPGELAHGCGWLDIDTGAYHPKSGWLTGLDLTHRKVYQVNVFQQSVRVLPLERAIAQVEPTQVHAHRQALHL